MKNINTIEDLENQILYLRNLRSEQEFDLKNHYHLTVESLKPTNIIKGALHNVLAAPDLKSTALKATIGFGTAVVSKLLYANQFSSPVKLVITQVLKYGINYFTNRKSVAVTAV